MADQKQITLYPGDAAAKDIVLRELPVAAVATTEIFLYPGDAVAKDVVLRSVPGAAADGSAANITGAGGTASIEAIGQPLVEAITGAADITGAGGIASAEAFGSPAVAAQISAAGIASAESFGSAALAAQITATGIASAEAFGSAELAAQITASGIASAEAIGSPAVAAQIAATGIASEEAIGQPLVQFDGPASILGAGGIASLEAFGQPQVGETVEPAAPVPIYGGGGIGFPLPTRPRQPPVQFYTPPWQIDAAGGIESGEAIGQPRISVSLAIASIRSKEQVGAARIRPGVIRNDEEFLMIA